MNIFQTTPHSKRKPAIQAETVKDLDAFQTLRQVKRENQLQSSRKAVDLDVFLLLITHHFLKKKERKKQHESSKLVS